jgi:glycosyltransferase involved in cell wall biosynthesis
MLSDVYFPRVNGVSTSIQTFARSFQEQGHTLTLIAPQYPEDTESSFNEVRIPSRALPFDPEDRLMSLKAIKRLLPRLKQLEIDIVHIQTPFVAHYAGVYLARALGLKIVVSYHTFFEAYFEKYLPWIPKRWLRAMARRFSKTQCNQVDALVSPSRQMLERLREYGVTQYAAVIPTGLPPEIFNARSSSTFRARNLIPDEAFMMLYVGRVAYEKNLELLISMFPRVRRAIDNAILLIAGEGPALDNLKKQARNSGHGDDIHFVGYLDRETELADCYQASDLFVFASQTETQGLVLLEAMANGLAVVSTASMGSLDVLFEGEGCLLAAPEADRFAERVIELHGNKALRRSLSQRGVRYARTWSSEAKARDMLDFYQGIVSGNPGQERQQLSTATAQIAIPAERSKE